MSFSAAIRTGTGAVRKSLAPRGAVINITENATKRIRDLLQQHPDAAGLKVGVKTRGCSGNQFVLNLAKEKGKFDEEVQADVWVENTAIMKVLNSTMDYVQDELGEKFVFENPQAKGKCGCGESFTT